MSQTILQFKEVVKEILDLEEKKKLIRSNFEKSTNELSECFHWIMEAELDNRKHTCLTVDTCPELYAKELESMGFIVEEQRNVFNTLCGYDIKWDNLMEVL